MIKCIEAILDQERRNSNRIKARIEILMTGINFRDDPGVRIRSNNTLKKPAIPVFQIKLQTSCH